jgi:hypothetical protein
VANATLTTATGRLTAAEALAIAEPDALAAYRDLTPFRVEIQMRSDGWYIDYELIDRTMQGGGPHYLIDAITGRIVRKKYEQ